MITVLARFKMQPGKESEALETLRDMATAVEASEPGALVYAMHRGQVDPLEIYTYEVYADHAAFAAHRKTPHMEELRSKFSHLMDPASFNVEVLERVAGFMRPPT
jgi:autoinducer 2-degrading protein